MKRHASSRSVFTTAEGVFRVTLLPPGNYTVTVKADGVRRAHFEVHPVTGSETSSLSVTLSIAGAAPACR